MQDLLYLLTPAVAALALGGVSARLKKTYVLFLALIAAAWPALQWSLLWFNVVRHENVKTQLTASSVNFIFVVVATPLCVTLFVLSRRLLAPRREWQLSTHSCH